MLFHLKRQSVKTQKKVCVTRWFSHEIFIYFKKISNENHIFLFILNTYFKHFLYVDEQESQVLIFFLLWIPKSDAQLRKRQTTKGLYSTMNVNTISLPTKGGPIKQVPKLFVTSPGFVIHGHIKKTVF